VRDLMMRCGECLLFAAIQGMADGLILVEDDGRVFHVNRRGQEILGLGPRRMVGSLIGDHLRIPQLATLWMAARAETVPITGEIRFPSGTSIQATISTCRSSSGAAIGKMILLRDTTREKRINVELAATVAERFIEIAGRNGTPTEILPLTVRERQILELLVEGLTNAQMARRLNISLNTVASHLKNMYTKLNVDSRTRAVALGMSHGIRPRDGSPVRVRKTIPSGDGGRRGVTG
jgi:PAS domain S-box-containing protein